MAGHSKTCGGLTKSIKPCRIAFNLNSLGYCKYHSPFATQQCRAIATSTGRRCKIMRDLDSYGFCGHHYLQNPIIAPRRSLGWAETKNSYCKVTSGLDAAGFCSFHRPRVNTGPTCQGTLLNTTKQCSRVAKPDYLYCCAAHNPAMPCYNPTLFRSDTLTRSYLENEVVALYNYKDLYHGDTIDLVTCNWTEMDHIVENHMFSNTFARVDFQDREEETQVAVIVRDEVVNKVQNLCFTRKTTNRIKGAAVFNFLDDTLTGHVGHRGNGTTFVAYMLGETYDHTLLGRPATRKISQEMGSALKFCQRKLAAEGETPILKALSQELQNLYVTMELHTGTRRRSSL